MDGEAGLISGGIRRVPIPDSAIKPLNGLQVRSLLDHDEDLDALLSRVAASSRLVMDAGAEETR